MDKIYDISNTSDIPNFDYEDRERPVYKNNTSRLVELIQSAGDYINAEQLRAAYYRKYAAYEDFFPLSLYQVKFLLNILNHYHDFKKKNGKIMYNTDKRTKIDYYEVASMFEGREMSTVEAYKEYKNKSTHLNVPKGAFINTLNYLCQKNCLARHTVNKQYVYHLNNINAINGRLESMISVQNITDSIQNKNMSLDEVCENLGTTKGKLLGSLRRTGMKWQSRKKKKVRDVKSGRVWESASECAKELQVSRQYINQSMKRNVPVKGVFLEFFEE